MVSFTKYQNKRIAIYGMGRTGCSAARTFKKLRSKIFCWDDDKKIRKKIKNFNFPLDKFWLNKNSIDVIVISPGINIDKCKLKNYLKKNSHKIITDIDLFFELNKDSIIISITGTNGKSTTCKIIEKILKTANYNVKTVGNIGNPILSFNKSIRKCIYILEASSYQLEYSKLFRSKHSAILNISSDHLERHKNIKNYTKIKTRVFFGQNSSDFSYVNSSSKYLKLIKNIFKTKKLKSKLIYVNKNNCNFLLKKIKNKYFENNANIENIAFAYNIAKNLKISDTKIIEALNKFKGLPHRQEIVFSNKSVLCINDSKATSFDAALNCLQHHNKIYWIVGGLPKLRDNFNIAKISKKIVKAYIVGKNPYFFKRQIEKKVPYKISHNIQNALNNICKDLKNSKNVKNTILLSPAAASFDQFRNFEERGYYFKKIALKKLKSLFNV